MITHVVVDVGNSRVKFGLSADDKILDSVALAHDPELWNALIPSWRLAEPTRLFVAGVVPETVAKVKTWAESRGNNCQIIASHSQVPIDVDVEKPEQVGIDRLFGCAAAREQFPGKSLLVIDAGSAITVNAVDKAGVFRGGAILPGLRLMARALHTDTAQLPDVMIEGPTTFPARNTDSAIRCGIMSAACGAIERLAHTYQPEKLVITGGDGPLLEPMICFPNKNMVPRLTLEGIRIASAKLK